MAGRYQRRINHILSEFAQMWRHSIVQNAEVVSDAVEEALCVVLDMVGLLEEQLDLRALLLQCAGFEPEEAARAGDRDVVRAAVAVVRGARSGPHLQPVRDHEARGDANAEVGYRRRGQPSLGHGRALTLELRRPVEALAQSGEVALDHVLGHTRAVVTHEDVVLVPLVVVAPSEGHAQLLGVDGVYRLRRALARVLELPPQVAQVHRVESVLEQLPDAERWVAPERSAEQQLLDLVLVESELDVLVDVGVLTATLSRHPIGLHVSGDFLRQAERVARAVFMQVQLLRLELRPDRSQLLVDLAEEIKDRLVNDRVVRPGLVL